MSEDKRKMKCPACGAEMNHHAEKIDAPQNGRPIPADERANDIVHWQTTLTVNDAETAFQRLSASEIAFVSSGVVTIPDAILGFKKGFLVRDPDGHVMQIIEK